MYALVDTGARPVSVINEAIYRDLFPDGNRKLFPLHKPIYGVSGNQMDVLGCVDLTVDIAHCKIRHRFVVARNIKQNVILGWDFLIANNIDLHVSEGFVTIDSIEIPFISEDELIPMSCSVVIDENIVLPGNTEVVVPMRVVNSQCTDEIRPDYPGIFEPDNFDNSETMIACSCTATVSRKGIIPVIVMNLSDEKVTMYENTPMGTYYSTTDMMGEVYEILEGDDFDRVSDMKSTYPKKGKPYSPVDLSNSDLDDEKKQKVQALLDDYDDIFSKHSRDFGRTDVVRHKVDLTDTKPPKQHNYRVAPKLRNILREKVDELLEDDMIELSTSSFAAPALLVRKKSPDKSVQYRFVVDFRATNKITLKDSHALARIDDSIDALQGNVYFSTVDLSSGFWQMEVEPNDRHKTAFSTGDGLYQWKVMPMGMKNSSSSFTRLMELVFRGMHWTKVCFFIDDIIIFGKSFQQKLTNLEEAFDRLRKANLKVRPDKCQIFCKEVIFLGHKVSREGILPDNSNIEKVKKWGRPTDIASVRGFLGLTGFYRRFIPQYAKIEQPMLDLTKKGVPFIWSEDCEHAFVTLRDALISPPILKYPDYDCPFILYTDASAYAVGSILAQKCDNGKEHVIAYASKTLGKSERNWSTFDRELWAIIWSIRHFRHYLQGTEFLIVTDHKPLAGLRKIPLDQDPTGKRGRWATEIETLEWSIVYKPGNSHKNADAMSRLLNVDQVSANLIDVDSNRETNVNSKLTEGIVFENLAQNQKPSVIQKSVQVEVKDQVSSDQNKDTIPQQQVFSLEDDVDRLREMQRQDPDIKQVLNWIETKSPPHKSQLRKKPKLMKYRNVYRHLVVRNEILWRKYTQQGTNTCIFQAVIPETLVSEILPQLHGSTLSGHYGIQKTVQKALQYYFWPLMYTDISRFCKSCESCQVDSNPVPKYRAPLKPIIAERPMQIVAADIVELGLTSSGNRYVLVVTDLFTKYTNMYPLQRQTANAVAECLFVNYVRQHSVPECILSDQGVQFESAVTQSLCEKLGIRKIRTSTAHPECDGQTERMNRTIRAQLVRNSLSTTLVKNLNSRCTEWDQFIPQIEFAYNTTVHSTTGYSPFYLLHARHPRLPVQVMFGSENVLADTDNNNDMNAKVKQMCKSYNQASSFVRSANQKAKRSQKKQYDKKVRFREYKIGQLVYLTNPKAVRSKLTPRWCGPFRIIQKFNDGLNYQIVDANGISDIPRVVHFNRLKPKYCVNQNEFLNNHNNTEFQENYKCNDQIEDFDHPRRSSFRFRQRKRSKHVSKPQRNKTTVQNSPSMSPVPTASSMSPVPTSPSMSPDGQAALKEARKLAADRQSAIKAASQLAENIVKTRSGRQVKPPIRLTL